MFHTERYTLIHRGEVVSVGSDEASVRVDIGASGRSCAGCSLMASCGHDSRKSKDDFVVLRAKILSGSEAPKVGESVHVGLPAGNSLKVALLMFALPLTVFVMVAVVGTLMKCSDGIIAFSALVGAVLCFFIIYFIYRRRRSPWILISDNR